MAACGLYKAAGGIAAKGLAGPGLLPARLIDALYAMDEATLAKTCAGGGVVMALDLSLYLVTDPVLNGGRRLSMWSVRR